MFNQAMIKLRYNKYTVLLLILSNSITLSVSYNYYSQLALQVYKVFTQPTKSIELYNENNEKFTNSRPKDWLQKTRTKVDLMLVYLDINGHHNSEKFSLHYAGQVASALCTQGAGTEISFLIDGVHYHGDVKRWLVNDGCLAIVNQKTYFLKRSGNSNTDPE